MSTFVDCNLCVCAILWNLYEHGHPNDLSRLTVLADADCKSRGSCDLPPDLCPLSPTVGNCRDRRIEYRRIALSADLQLCHPERWDTSYFPRIFISAGSCFFLAS